MTVTLSMQQELEIDRAIDAQLNGMLRQMQKILDDSRIWESKMEVNQMQNLLAVAQETDSAEVVKNYIRYQIGRDGNAVTWRRRVGNNPLFGDQIITELDRLQSVAQAVVPKSSGQELIDRAWMKLVRLYLGHLRRYFYYKKRDKERS